MIRIKTAAMAAALGLFALPALAENFVQGVVEEITTDPQRVTLAHDAIPNLEMEAMTMVFRVADPAMLEALSVGQMIEFEAERINGRLTVTALRDPS